MIVATMAPATKPESEVAQVRPNFIMLLSGTAQQSCVHAHVLNSFAIPFCRAIGRSLSIPFREAFYCPLSIPYIEGFFNKAKNTPRSVTCSCWRRGRDSPLAPTRGHWALRTGLPLAALSRPSNRSPTKEIGATLWCRLFLWRRGRDSNSRNLAVCALSKRVHSTTMRPLRGSAVVWVFYRLQMIWQPF